MTVAWILIVRSRATSLSPYAITFHPRECWGTHAFGFMRPWLKTVSPGRDADCFGVRVIDTYIRSALGAARAAPE